MNTSYKHLDSKLRIAELTIGQWVTVLLGIGLAIVWALYVSPLGTTLTIMTSVYVAALPIGAGLSASFTDFDPWLMLRCALAWRRREGRYIPGPGQSPLGYVLLDDPHTRVERGAEERLADLDLASLWERA
jgi:hypothetical protein